MSKKYYFTPEHQSLIEQYFWANYSGNTELKNEYIVKLLPLFEIITRKCMFQSDFTQTEETVKDVQTRIATYIMPHLTNPKKIKGAFQYIWTSTINYVREIQRKNRTFIDINDVDVIASNTYRPDYSINTEETINEIRLVMLDKINNQTDEINKQFLIYMIDYLECNGFDPTGFKSYIIDKMEIKKSQYKKIMIECNVDQTLFMDRPSKEKKITI